MLADRVGGAGGDDALGLLGRREGTLGIDHMRDVGPFRETFPGLLGAEYVTKKDRVKNRRCEHFCL